MTVSQQLFFEFLRSKEKSNSFVIFNLLTLFFNYFIINNLFNDTTYFNKSIVFNIINQNHLCVFILIYLFQVKLLNTRFFKFDRNIFNGYIIPGLIFIYLGFFRMAYKFWR